MLFTSLIVQLVMIITLEKLNLIYAQEPKNMLLVIKEVQARIQHFKEVSQTD